MMIRTQISLEPEALRRARDRAGQLGISLAEYIRRLIARDLSEPGAVREATPVFDLGGSGGSDVARDKDAMLGDSIDRRRGKRR